MKEQCFGGFDVSQDRLDVLLCRRARASVANDEAGWARSGEEARPALAAIGLEPSGDYERGVLRALLAAGLSVRRINRTDFGSSPALAAPSPRTIGLMPG